MEAVKKFTVVNYDELICKGYNVKFVKIAGQKLFLIDKGGRLRQTGKQFPIVLAQKQKVSIGQQVIEAQKGRVPHMYETQRAWNYAVELPIPKFGTYSAWEVR